MTYNTFTFPCGLRLVYQSCQTPVAYCGYAIDCGTRDEREQESGMAHYVEHLLFKGTQRRRAWHILNRMEAVGGDLNAFTNKEETVVYTAFMAEHFSRAVDLLTDLVFCSVFPQKEMDKEVEVICDEIESYEDTPSELIFDDFEDLVFQNHPLGRNILGKPELLRSYRTKDIEQFYKRYYQPQNMVFFVRGNIPFSRCLDIIQKALNKISFSPWIRELRTPPAPYQTKCSCRCRNTHQAHVILGTRSYPAGDPKRTALYLLNNLLGGPGMNSKLNLSLRERRGLVYTVESNLSSYTDTGTFSIYFGADAHDVERCIDLCHKELNHLIETPLTLSQLHAAQKQIKGQIGVSCDNYENTILDIAKSYLHYGTIETIEDVFHRIDSLTPTILQETSQELFQKDNLSLLIYK